MNPLAQIVLGSGGFNESAIIRGLRLFGIFIALAALSAVGTYVTNGGLDALIKAISVGGYTLQPQTAVIVVTFLVAAAEKALRNRQGAIPAGSSELGALDLRWTAAWIMLGASALGLELGAVANQGAGDTLSEQVWWVLDKGPAVWALGLVMATGGGVLLVSHLFFKRPA